MSQPIREWMFWVAVGACAVAEAAIILSSIRSLRRSGVKSAIMETVWALLPAAGLVWLLFATWGEVKRNGAHEHMTMPMTASRN